MWTTRPRLRDFVTGTSWVGTYPRQSGLLRWSLALLLCLGPVSQTRLAHAQNSPVQIVVPAELSIIPTAAAPLSIEVVNGNSVADGSFVYFIDLPEGSSLSSGFKVTQSSWAVPLNELGDLTLLVPEFATPVEVRVQVLTPEGKSVADAATMLFPVDGASLANRPARAADTAAADLPSQGSYNGALAAAQAPDAQPGAGGETSAAATVEPSGTETASVAPIAPPPAPTPASPPAGEAAQQPQAAPEPEPPRQMTEEERERAVGLLTRGDQAMKSGNVLAARLFYHRAAKIGLAEAALAMAQSYDRVELQRMRVLGVEPDDEQARIWYARARELGLGRQ